MVIFIEDHTGRVKMAPPRTIILPSRAKLRELLRYDAKTGKLFWQKRPGLAGWNARLAGKEAFTYVNRGHRRGLLFRKSVYAHRVIWRMMTGHDPTEIDHIDGNPLNNAWRNLRLAVGGANQKNSPKRRDNTSGQVGVVKRGDRWIAQIGVSGTTKHIGIFETKEQAVMARKELEQKYCFHKNHGREQTE